jgi:pyruvate/2-oxoglutarate dehydrogenase complex dihydrolipoamide acyltransferase (E2) component
MSTGRRTVYDLLRRSMRNHASVTGVYDWDVTDTLARIDELRSQGREVGIAAFMAKATALALAEHPKLNRRLFRSLLGLRIVQWDQISCNIVIERRNAQGDAEVVPLVLRDTDKRSIEDLHQEIQEAKTAPLEELPAYRQRRKIPRVLLPFINLLIMYSPRFFIRHFGTYGLSALLHEGSGAIGGSAITPCTSFYPTRIEEKPVVRSGEIAVRKMVMFGICIDHYVVDGMEALRCCMTLKELVENPDRILGGGGSR